MAFSSVFKNIRAFAGAEKEDQRRGPGPDGKFVVVVFDIKTHKCTMDKYTKTQLSHAKARFTFHDPNAKRPRTTIFHNEFDKNDGGGGWTKIPFRELGIDEKGEFEGRPVRCVAAMEFDEDGEIVENGQAAKKEPPLFGECPI